MKEVKLGKTFTEIHQVLETLYEYEVFLVRGAFKF